MWPANNWLMLAQVVDGSHVLWPHVNRVGCLKAELCPCIHLYYRGTVVNSRLEEIDRESESDLLQTLDSLSSFPWQ